MNKASRNTRKGANKRPDTRVGKSRQGRRAIVAAMQLVRGKFGSKASLELALRTEADQRSAERWKQGKGMSAENFAALICSDIGDQVLDAMMGTDPKLWPDWYRGLRRQMRLSSLRQGLAAQQRELERLELESAP